MRLMPEQLTIMDVVRAEDAHSKALEQARLDWAETGRGANVAGYERGWVDALNWVLVAAEQHGVLVESLRYLAQVGGPMVSAKGDSAAYVEIAVERSK